VGRRRIEARSAVLCAKEFPDDRCQGSEPKNSCLWWRDCGGCYAAPKLTHEEEKDAVYNAENAAGGRCRALSPHPHVNDKEHSRPTEVTSDDWTPGDPLLRAVGSCLAASFHNWGFLKAHCKDEGAPDSDHISQPLVETFLVPTDSLRRPCKPGLQSACVQRRSWLRLKRLDEKAYYEKLKVRMMRR